MTHHTDIADPMERLGLPEFIALFALLSALTAFSIDAMLPALSDIGRSLSISNANDTQFIVTMFFVGIVIGEPIFGPLSDSIGRRKAILIGIFTYCIGSGIALCATSFGHLIAGRILQGIGVSGPKIVSKALIRDDYEGDAMARVMSFITMIFIFIPMIAPAFGQVLQSNFGWRSIFLSFLTIGLIAVTWFGVRQPETLSVSRRIPFSAATIIKSIGLILRHVRIMAYMITTGLIFGVHLVYLSTSKAMFQDFYSIDERFPLYFAILASAIGIASLTNGHLVMRFGMHRLAILALVGLVANNASLLTISIAHDGIPPFQWFMVHCFFMFFCLGVFFGNINAMAMQSLGRIAGLGASLITSISNIVAVVISVFVGQFYDGTLLPLSYGWTLSTIAALLLVYFSSRFDDYVL